MAVTGNASTATNATDSTTLNGKSESNLHVAYADNSSVLGNTRESNLRVAYATNSTTLNSKNESELNVSEANWSDYIRRLSSSDRKRGHPYAYASDYDSGRLWYKDPNKKYTNITWNLANLKPHRHGRYR